MTCKVTQIHAGHLVSSARVFGASAAIGFRPMRFGLDWIACGMHACSQSSVRIPTTSSVQHTAQLPRSTRIYPYY